MILSEQVRGFFRELGHLLALMEYGNSGVWETAKEEIIAATANFPHKFICQLAARRGASHNWYPDSAKLWVYNGKIFSDTASDPTRPYDFAVDYNSTERYVYGLFVWIENEKIISPMVGQREKFIFLQDCTLGTTEFSHFSTDLWDVTGNREVYKPTGKLNVLSKDFVGICKPLEEWLFQCVYETFPGQERGVKFWKPIKLLKGIPDVKVGKDGVILTHNLPYNKQIREPAKKILWDVSRRIISTISNSDVADEFVSSSSSISPEEEEVLKQLITAGKVIGARISNSLECIIRGETLLQVKSSPIEFVSYSYDHKTNSISGVINVPSIGLMSKGFSGEFPEFAHYEGRFLRKCYFCNHMATFILSVKMIGKCSCHDDYEGHIHWDNPRSCYTTERAFCPDHQTEANSAIESMPIASEKDNQEGRMSFPGLSNLIN